MRQRLRFVSAVSRTSAGEVPLVSGRLSPESRRIRKLGRFALFLRLSVDGQAAGLRTARYRVDRATPKRAAISATGMSAALSSARMVLISLAESLAGRPPFRPRARAAFRPATVRSRRCEKHKITRSKHQEA